jgi:hypothetical protein
MSEPQNINFRIIDTQIGEELKYTSTLNEIDRMGQSILKIIKEEFQNQSITSSRAQSIYNWILSLAKSPMEYEDRIKRLIQFCFGINPETEHSRILKILVNNKYPYNLVYKDSLNDFYSRNFHAEVIKHSKNLFLQENYFHVIFESSKAYNNDIKSKSLVDKDGQPLMLLDSKNGVLKITPCETQIDKDYQDGI